MGTRELTQVQQMPTVFDEDGNLQQAVLKGENITFTFNSRNQLLHSNNVHYQYDAENQRIAVNQTQYVINSQPALSQMLVKTDNGQSTYYVYGLGLIGEESAGNYVAYHYDFRGSTVALTDKNGQVIENIHYSPFGELLTQPTHNTPFLFNGMYGVMTGANGLNYMRARYYSADIRRFVNQDVLLGNIADGQSLNRFAFVTGNPVSFVDPFGLKPACSNGKLSRTWPEEQPHVYECKGNDMKKVCASKNDERGCHLFEAPQGGSNDGARCYGGFGGYVDTHYILIGANSETAFISQGGKACQFRTDCMSIGPGFFLGSGGHVPFGIAMDDIESSLSGSSLGFSLDIGACLKSYGGNIGIGYNESGITSVGSSKGSARFGVGCGLSFTLDICNTESQGCNKP